MSTIAEPQIILLARMPVAWQRPSLTGAAFLQTAERTKELAANTLGELQHQGQKLDMIDRDLHDVRALPGLACHGWILMQPPVCSCE